MKEPKIFIFKPSQEELDALNAKAVRRKCNCICHRLKGVRHMDMCCIDGYVWELIIEPKAV